MRKPTCKRLPCIFTLVLSLPVVGNENVIYWPMLTYSTLQMHQKHTAAYVYVAIWPQKASKVLNSFYWLVLTVWYSLLWLLKWFLCAQKRFVQTASSISNAVNKTKVFSTADVLLSVLTDTDFRYALRNIWFTLLVVTTERCLELSIVVQCFYFESKQLTIFLFIVLFPATEDIASYFNYSVFPRSVTNYFSSLVNLMIRRKQDQGEKAVSLRFLSENTRVASAWYKSTQPHTDMKQTYHVCPKLLLQSVIRNLVYMRAVYHSDRTSCVFISSWRQMKAFVMWSSSWGCLRWP